MCVRDSVHVVVGVARILGNANSNTNSDVRPKEAVHGGTGASHTGGVVRTFNVAPVPRVVGFLLAVLLVGVVVAHAVDALALLAVAVLLRLPAVGVVVVSLVGVIVRAAVVGAR